MHLYFDFTYNSSALVGSAFGATWKDPGGAFIKFAVTRALKQDQIVHMVEKLQFICYFSRECKIKILIYLMQADVGVPLASHIVVVVV